MLNLLKNPPKLPALTREGWLFPQGGRSTLTIWEGDSKEIDDRFSAAAIPVNLSLSKTGERAEAVRRQGKLIVWEWEKPPRVSALKTFQEKLLKPFLAHSLGIILYRGRTLPEIDLLKERISGLPDVLFPFFCLDLADCVHPSQLYQTLPLADLEPLLPILNVAPSLIPFLPTLGALGWGVFSPWGYRGEEYFPEKAYDPPKIGVVLPAGSAGWEEIDPIAWELERVQKPFRAIPEKNLHMEWEGLETLIAPTRGISFQGERKLSGFMAAGGEIVRGNPNA